MNKREHKLLKSKKRLYIIFVLLGLSYISNIFIRAGQDNFRILIDNNIIEYKERKVRVKINNDFVTTKEMPAIIYYDRVLVPAREIFENQAIGAKVDWNQDKKEIYVTYMDKFIVLKIDSKIAYIEENGKNNKVELDVPAKLIRDMTKEHSKTMVPIRFLSENLGFEVGWDPDNYIAMVETDQAIDNKKEEEAREDIKEEVKEEPKEGANEKHGEDDKAASSLLAGGEKFSQAIFTGEKSPATSLTPAPKFKTINIRADKPIKKIIEGPLGNEFIHRQEKEARIFNIKRIDDETRPYINAYEIAAVSPISRVESFYLNNRLIVDVHNARHSMKTTSFQTDYNPSIKSINVEMQGQAPNRYTRFIFDLRHSDVDFKISLDRIFERITVEIVDKALIGLKISKDDVGEYIDIETSGQTDILTKRGFGEVEFDIRHVANNIGNEKLDIGGEYIKSLSVETQDQASVICKLKLNGDVDIKIERINPIIQRIIFKEAKIKNFNVYLNDGKSNTISIKKDEAINISKDMIKTTFNIYKKEGEIRIPNYKKSHIGPDYINIDSGVLAKVYFKDSDTNDLLIKFESKDVREILVDEDQEYYYIKLVKPKDVYERVVFIDIGHGGTDPGAIKRADIGFSNKLYKEKDINFEIYRQLREYLDTDSKIKAYYSREDDSYLSLIERAELANDIDADFLISIHANSVSTRGKKAGETIDDFYARIRGTDIYYTERPERIGLSANRMAEILKVYMEEETDISHRRIGETGELYMLKYPKMPSIILEAGFVSNIEDLKLLTNEDQQRRIGLAIYKTIIKLYHELQD